MSLRCTAEGNLLASHYMLTPPIKSITPESLPVLLVRWVLCQSAQLAGLYCLSYQLEHLLVDAFLLQGAEGLESPVMFAGYFSYPELDRNRIIAHKIIIFTGVICVKLSQLTLEL